MAVSLPWVEGEARDGTPYRLTRGRGTVFVRHEGAVRGLVEVYPHWVVVALDHPEENTDRICWPREVVERVDFEFEAEAE